MQTRPMVQRTVVQTGTARFVVIQSVVAWTHLLVMAEGNAWASDNVSVT